MKDWNRILNAEERRDWDVSPWLGRCLAVLTEFMDLAKGEEFQHHPFAVDGWSAVALYDGLAFYGRYGAVSEEVPADEREHWIVTSIEKARRLQELAPRECGDEAPTRILAIACGRHQIEDGTEPIEPIALALLGGVSEGRVRNLMSGNSAQLTSIGGKIPVEEARSWLNSRPEYWPSIWRGDEHVQLNAEQITVPRASDGTIFHPALRRRNGYTIGKKGVESTFEDFDDALNALSAMPEARWRRPNQQGNWGIVRAKEWISILRRDLHHLRL
jgi:hypothetical protein